MLQNTESMHNHSMLSDTQKQLKISIQNSLKQPQIGSEDDYEIIDIDNGKASDLLLFSNILYNS